MRVNSRLEEQRSGTQLLRAVLSTTLNGQRTWVSEYDGATRTARLRTPLGRGGESGLDELGRLSWSRSPTGTEVRYQYRPDNRLQQLTEVSRSGQQRVWQFGYDRYGHLTQVTDPRGRVSSVERDLMGQVLRSHDPAGRTTDYQYNKNGDVTALTPPERPAHQFEYDSQGRMTLYRPPLLSGTSTHRQWRFDRDGRLVQAQEQSGEQLSQSYDAFSGHPTVSQAQPGERSESQFDDAGRLSRLSYAPGTAEHSQLDFSYDGGLLLAVHSSGVSQGSVTYHYDADLRLSDYQINQQRIPLQYDLDGLLTQHGPLTLQRALPTGVLQGTQLEALSTQLSYDDFDQLQQYQAQFNQSELYRYQLQRDELGRIIGKRETLLGETHEYQYRYDEAQRLIEVQRDRQRLQQWSYDANNNRQSAEWQHDSHDRLLHSSALARPLPSGTRSYRTDALGRRVQTLHNGAVESTLLYSTGLLPIAKLDAQQQLAQLYLYAERANSPSVILQRTAHGFTPYRVITDHLGSPRLIVNAQTGDIAQQLDYDVWGQVLQDTQPGFQPFGFAGGLYDPQTGLVRFGARDYDPYAGRWLAKDPIGFGGGDGNLYAYVGNDPVNWIDMLGLAPGKHPLDAAAYAAICENINQSIKIDKETHGVLIEKNGIITSTPPEIAEFDSAPTNKVAGWLAAWHTHGDGKNKGYLYFSGEDQRQSRFEWKPIYMGDPEGYVHRYDPNESDIYEYLKEKNPFVFVYGNEKIILPMTKGVIIGQCGQKLYKEPILGK